jgi:hypothetical protein
MRFGVPVYGGFSLCCCTTSVQFSMYIARQGFHSSNSEAKSAYTESSHMEWAVGDRAVSFRNGAGLPSAAALRNSKHKKHQQTRWMQPQR